MLMPVTQSQRSDLKCKNYIDKVFCALIHTFVKSFSSADEINTIVLFLALECVENMLKILSFFIILSQKYISFHCPKHEAIVFKLT